MRRARHTTRHGAGYVATATFACALTLVCCRTDLSQPLHGEWFQTDPYNGDCPPNVQTFGPDGEYTWALTNCDGQTTTLTGLYRVIEDEDDAHLHNVRLEVCTEGDTCIDSGIWTRTWLYLDGEGQDSFIEYFVEDETYPVKIWHRDHPK